MSRGGGLWRARCSASVQETSGGLGACEVMMAGEL